MNKICIVTGGSSGIGLAATKAMRDAGYTVYEFSRRGEGAEELFAHPHLLGPLTGEDVSFHIDAKIQNISYICTPSP